MRQSPLVFTDAMERVQTDTFWTYRGQTNRNKRKILSEVVDQGVGTGTCAFHASTAALEAILRLHGHNIGKLSVVFLHNLYRARIQERTQYSKLELICKILQDTGVIEESNIGTPLEDAEKFKISGYIFFDPKNEDSLVQAVDHMKNVGPLIASYYQNKRWYEDPRSTAILADDPADRVFDVRKNQYESHAVCVPGFGAEALSYFEFQDSAGVKVHKEGFGRILPSSLQELLGFEVSDQANKRSRR